MVAGAKIVALACLTLIILIVPGCDGGDDSGWSGSNFSPAWIYIETNNLTTLTDATSVELRGKAYCDICPPSETAFGYCPSVSPTGQTEVAVTWANTTTGASGTAMHAVVGGCSCFFSYCTVSYSHGWVVYYLPLAMGENALTVSATYAGYTATDSVMVTRVPQKVTGLTATTVGAEIVLQWDSVPEATAYTLYWSTDPAFTKATAHVVTDVASPFVHSSLTADTTHYYLVTAVSGAFESAASSKVFATSGWPITVLADTTATAEIREVSLAVDDAQALHVHYAFDECLSYTTLPNGVSYCNQHAWHNNYLTTTGGTPVVQPLPPVTYAVDANIVLTADGTPHVSYDGAGAIHGWHAGGLWQTETVDASGWCGTSLAAAGDRLHLAYFAEAGSTTEIRYAGSAGGSWTPQIVTQYASGLSCDDRTPGSLAVAVDGGGAPRIAYAGRYPDYGLYQARQEAGAWRVESVDAGSVQNLDMAIDADGLGLIANVRYDNYLWLVREDASGGWTSTTVNDERASGQPAVAIDAGGRVHVAYIGLNYELRYGMLSNGEWRFLSLDSNAQSGADLVLDTFGKVHIVYFGGGQLKYVSNR